MSSLIVEVSAIDAIHKHPDAELCKAHEVSMCPVICRGPFSLDAIKTASTGNTTHGTANHIREGVVVKPLTERTDPKIGRVILKYLNDDYLLKKEEGRVSDSTDQ